MHSHDGVVHHHHHHDSDPERSARALRAALALTLVVLVAEVVGGFVSNSLALLADAGHVLTDAAALGLSLFVAWFSRQREFRADRGSAQYLGNPNPMINALRRLAGTSEAAALPESVRTLGITDKKGLFALMSTHPPFEERIAALQATPR